MEGVQNEYSTDLYGVNERLNLYSGCGREGSPSGTVCFPTDVEAGESEQDQRGSYRYPTIADPAYDHRNDSFFLDRQSSDYQDPSKVNPNCFTLRAMDYDTENFYLAIRNTQLETEVGTHSKLSI